MIIIICAFTENNNYYKFMSTFMMKYLNSEEGGYVRHNDNDNLQVHNL